MMILFDLRLRDCEPVVGIEVNRVERGGWTGLREWQPSVVLFVDKNVWLVWFLFWDLPCFLEISLLVKILPFIFSVASTFL